MSDPMAEVFAKYMVPQDDGTYVESEQEIFDRESEQPCSQCGSENIDRSRGYRGEYRCRDCHHSWQVGGKDSRI